MSNIQKFKTTFFFFKKKGTRRCIHCPDPLKPDFDMAWVTSGQ